MSSVFQSDIHFNESVGGKANRSAAATRWQQLITLMERERPYLDTQLMQQEIADRLSVSCRTLSRLIGEQSYHNFNGLVNDYRLREAKRLLRDPQYASQSVDAIATLAGFNSRGTFYRAFKQSEGRSPAAYRKG
ncbi:HTH-type transcriptional activator RhaS [Neolewinella maritima]|uniref:HTH-type transcriptional activator RhaS n=1 Tax=Neolewinella maritima TaxID=1383882 RepID=A0ABN8F8F7_9BACT|nr:helix-turn-helix transcriptional regulator [Neolewinella maritima]CAH1000835.1 HTH-type transcriptional activator RhaS [Neolewinella maritima]